jgi:hypothetical protein
LVLGQNWGAQNGYGINVNESGKAQFEKINQLVDQSAGVNLHTGKQELVKARLAKRQNGCICWG